MQFRTDPQGFFPYLRDEETLSRPWVIPGTPGLEHRIGGLEKEYLTGNVSYAPITTSRWFACALARSPALRARSPPPRSRADQSGDLLVVGWGSTYGSIRTAVAEARRQGQSVSHVHLRYLNPLPPDLGDILARFNKVLVPEMNLGQLVRSSAPSTWSTQSDSTRFKGFPSR